MLFTPLPLSGAYLIDLEKREDERGFFARYFCEKEFSERGLPTHWVQMNISLSREKGTLRGLHFQRPPKAEVKVVRCLRGSIWDVIVDLREDSATFGQWYGSELNAENCTMMYVPKGFAHGYITLKKNSTVVYLVDTKYNPKSEKGIRYSNKRITIMSYFHLTDIIKLNDLFFL